MRNSCGVSIFVLMSPDAHLTETIGIDDATGRLRITWQLHDAAFYCSALVSEFTLEPSSIDFEPFDCIPDQS